MDINFFRQDKGGNPELIRESQRRRFDSVEIVDQIIGLDSEWRKGIWIPMIKIKCFLIYHNFFIKSEFFLRNCLIYIFLQPNLSLTMS